MAVPKALQKIERYVSISGLVFDLIVAFLAGLIFSLIVPRGGDIRSLFPQDISPYATVTIEFSIAYILGRLASSYLSEDIFSRGTAKIALAAVYTLSALFILFALYITLPPILGAEGWVSYLFGIFIIIFGAFSGLSGWMDEDDSAKKPNEPRSLKKPDGDGESASRIGRSFDWAYKESERISYGKHPILIIIPMISFLGTIIGIIMVFEKTTGFLAILLFAGAIVAGLIALWITGMVCMLTILGLEILKRKLPSLDFLIRMVLYPGASAMVLMLWNQIYLEAALRAGKEGGTALRDERSFLCIKVTAES